MILVHKNARIDPMLYIIHRYNPNALTFSLAHVLFSCVPPNVISLSGSYLHAFPLEIVKHVQCSDKGSIEQTEGKDNALDQSEGFSTLTTCKRRMVQLPADIFACFCDKGSLFASPPPLSYLNMAMTVDVARKARSIRFTVKNLVIVIWAKV